jgi:hypothetical protein
MSYIKCKQSEHDITSILHESIILDVKIPCSVYNVGLIANSTALSASPWALDRIASATKLMSAVFSDYGGPTLVDIQKLKGTTCYDILGCTQQMQQPLEKRYERCGPETVPRHSS